MRVSTLPASLRRAVFILFFVMTPTLAYSRDRVEVQCAEGRSFVLEIEERRAIASFEGRQLILPRRPLDLGAYYKSEEGGLLIDGSFAAFVPVGDPNWRDCQIQAPADADIPS